MSIVDAGDEVIIPTPYWVTYSEIVKMAGGVVKFVHTSWKTGTRSHPPNWSSHYIQHKIIHVLFALQSIGAVYSKEELKALAEVLKAPRHLHHER